jgi:hypothetical protein
MINEKMLGSLVGQMAPLVDDPSKWVGVDDLIEIYLEEFNRFEKTVVHTNPDLKTKFWRDSLGLIRSRIRGQEKSNIDLLRRKHAAYGGKSLIWCGHLGVVTRSLDKLARIKNLGNNPGVDNLNESTNDSWSDLFNYAVLGYLLSKGGIT